MYVNLCIPAVAGLQWHPISLAGAPSADSLAVLVRNSGGCWHSVDQETVLSVALQSQAVIGGAP